MRQNIPTNVSFGLELVQLINVVRMNLLHGNMDVNVNAKT